MHREQVILVTGSSKGIGAALARGLFHEGHCIVINYAHSRNAAEALFGELASLDRQRVLLVKADVSSRTAVHAMFDQTVKAFGRVDALINNAGLNIDGPFTTMIDEAWDRVIATVLTGTFICSQEFLFHFKGSAGNLINIAAPTALRGRKNGANYCSAKAGVIALTKCLARELAPRIRVNCVIPDFVDTDEVRTRFTLDEQDVLDRLLSSIPMGRLGDPSEILSVVNYLLNGATFSTGHLFFVDGGRTM